MTSELPPVPPPRKPPSTARGAVPVLAGAGVALGLGVLFWMPLVAAEHLLGSDLPYGALQPAETLLGSRHDGYPQLALASAALQAVVALVLTVRLWRDRRAEAISIAAFAPAALFVSWLLWVVTHINWC